MKYVPISVLRGILIFSATTIGLLAILVPAAFTNWFRYPLSLEANFVLVPVFIIVLVGIILHAWAFWTLGRSYIAPFAAVASLLIAGVTTAALTKEAFGQWIPSLADADIDRNDDQVTHGSDGVPVAYHLELHNPFAKTAKTYLVGTVQKRSFKVPLPIGSVAGYGQAVRASDWVTLSPSSQPHVFVAKVTVDPSRVHTFAVDVVRETARELH